MYGCTPGSQTTIEQKCRFLLDDEKPYQLKIMMKLVHQPIKNGGWTSRLYYIHIVLVVVVVEVVAIFRMRR